VKDIEVADFNNDGKIDIVTRQNPSHVAIYIQNNPTSFNQLGPWSYRAKEGMAVGDIDDDNDTDVVLNGYWIQNPYPIDIDTQWSEYTIDSQWYTGQSTPESWQRNCSKVATGDINGDGKDDVVISHSEAPNFDVRLYISVNPTSGPGGWDSSAIDSTLAYVHNLGIADFNNDGKNDVFAAEMLETQSPEGKVFLNDNNGSSWNTLLLPDFNGMYSGVIGDLGNDGDIDIIGARDHDPPCTIEIWENKPVGGTALPLDQWTYKNIDNNRERFQGGPPYMGLAAEDITGDGFKDIISGKYFYRNPGGNITNNWTRVVLPYDADCSLIVDVDGDQYGDTICMASDELYWMEATNPDGSSWSYEHIQDVEWTGPDHRNTQGYALGQIEAGGRPEVVMAFGDGMHYLEIPSSNPEGPAWPMTRISTDNEGGGLALGYIDDDDCLDVAASNRNNHNYDVSWYKNPCNGNSDWTRIYVGLSGYEISDRFEIVDIDGDGRKDIVVSTEVYPQENRGGLFWFKAPSDPVNGSWNKRTIVGDEEIDGGESMNSMHVADFDNDGDIDIIAGEIWDPLRHLIFENDGLGNFTEHVIDTGHESHLGALPVDLDNDGDLDVISHAWHDEDDLHLLRNNAL